jgi:hypothetical protein
MPIVTHSPLVPSAQSRMWSMAALAADAADDRPRASMIAAPRLPTVGMNTCRGSRRLVVDQRLDRSAPSMVAKAVVGVHRGRVVAPHDQLLDRIDCLAGLGGQLRQRTVVVQAEHGGEVLLRQIGRRLHRDVRVGVGRVADDQDLDSSGWRLRSAHLPWAVKMAPLASSRSACVPCPCCGDARRPARRSRCHLKATSSGRR